MDEKIKNSEIIVKHWLDFAEQNFKTLEHMLDSKDYSWALFLGHLVIEKVTTQLTTYNRF